MKPKFFSLILESCMPYRIHLQIWLLNPVWMACHFDYYTLYDLFLWLYLCLQPSGKKYDIDFQNKKTCCFCFIQRFNRFEKWNHICYTSAVKRTYTSGSFKRNNNFQVFHEVSGSARHLCFQIPNFLQLNVQLLFNNLKLCLHLQCDIIYLNFIAIYLFVVVVVLCSWFQPGIARSYCFHPV